MATQPDDRDLCTVGDVKTALSIPLSATTHDDLLQQIITGESSAIAQFLSRPLFEDVFEERYTGSGRDRLMLRQQPASELLSLTICGTPVTILDDPDVAGAGAFLDEGVVYGRQVVFPRLPPKAIAVMYRAGWDDDTRPAEIFSVARTVCAFRFRELDRLGLVSQGMAGQTTAYSQKDLPAWAQRQLGAYQRLAPI